MAKTKVRKNVQDDIFALLSNLPPKALCAAAMEGIDSMQASSCYLETDLATTHPQLIEALEGMSLDQALLLAEQAISLLRQQISKQA